MARKTSTKKASAKVEEAKSEVVADVAANEAVEAVDIPEAVKSDEENTEEAEVVKEEIAQSSSDDRIDIPPVEHAVEEDTDKPKTIKPRKRNVWDAWNGVLMDW